MALHYSLYISTASTPAGQLCDHEMLLKQSKGSCDNCVTTGYMCHDLIYSSSNA